MTTFRSLVLAACLPFGLLASCAQSPEVPDAAYGPMRGTEQATATLEARIERNPGDWAAWQELTTGLAISGDPVAAMEAADRCVRANPRDSRAWLIHASTARLLNDFLTASNSLESAVNVGGGREAMAARASLMMELGLWQSAKTVWDELAALGDPKATVGTAICLWMNGQHQLAIATLSNSQPASTDAQLLAQLELIAGQPRPRNGWGDLPPELLLRFSSQPTVAQTRGELTLALQTALQTADLTEQRLAILIGMWQLAWQAEAEREGPGIPPGIDKLSDRIRAVAGQHPEWLTREALASDLMRTPERLESAKQALDQAGLICPIPAKTHKELLIRLQVQDLASLGELALAHPRTLEAARAAIQLGPDDLGLRMLLVECLVAAGDGQAAIAQLNEWGAVSGPWTSLRLRALLAAKDYAGVVSSVERISTNLARRIGADALAGMARYHLARQ